MRDGAGGTTVSAILRTLLVVLSVACSNTKTPSHTPTNTDIQLSGFGFIPTLDTVSVGDTVTFHNRDMVPHNVTSGTTFNSDSLKAGADWRWVATRAGRFDYICAYHPTMKGTLVVE
jgi:plastocyanin